MEGKTAQIETLGQILERSLKRLDPAGRLIEYGVWPIWNDTVGPLIAQNAQPERIRHGTLFVRVAAPTWMQQLQYLKEMIMERLNQRLGGGVVKNIFFAVGKVIPPNGAFPAPRSPNSRAEEPRLALNGPTGERSGNREGS